MIQVKIYCSIRLDEDSNATMQLFSDLKCAKIDQTLQPHFKNLGKEFIYSFTLVVDGGSTYVDEIMTTEEYIKYLENEVINQSNKKEIKKAIKSLKIN